MIKRLVKSLLAEQGWELTHIASREAHAMADLPEADCRIVQRVAPFTMTSIERRAALIGAVDHVVQRGVEGAIVECGVWRGGSMMTAALALMDRGQTQRALWLYDTFEGMSEPTAADRSHDGLSAQKQLDTTARGQGVWCEASLEDVQANLRSTGYPWERIHFQRGKVEDTIPAALPGAIAVLRLDTDWYESTRHELQHLYPLLQPGGVLIIDDYGHWQGARQAVDEYFAGQSIYLHRVDYTGRLMVKP
jgi:O-methyltransferase